MADALAPLLAWMQRPDGIAEGIEVDPVDIPVVSTNWRTTPQPAEMSPEDVDGMRTERRWAMRPTVGEIMAEVAEGKTDRNADGQIVAIGRLRFSDGSQTERGYRYSADGKITACSIRMPTGSMLGVRDIEERALGGEGSDGSDIDRSNRYFAEVFGAAFRFLPGGRICRGRSYTAAESRAMLADAIANTPVMPEVRRYPAGLPCGSRNVAENFIGMRKEVGGGGGSVGWEDIFMAHINRSEWAATVANLSDESRQTLDATEKAKGIADLAPGRRGGNAYAAGRKRLQAANDNLMAAMKKVAA
ncbi:hypothetical protein [Consotaella salsifontis]|uniref:Uncharacterized protein n=1 Tax=Consotaella salsifontis TaxID=1365950 RepID=A0A1T4SSB6_9HYPH|nr:hypothetical protein [Consotaella salsifontis]SKA31077.1 hypothetical protein SAMN05428963_113113 [Consotaella salsifontis]